jgi:hypothetical protein
MVFVLFQMQDIELDELKGDISRIFFKDDVENKIANLEEKLKKLS